MAKSLANPFDEYLGSQAETTVSMFQHFFSEFDSHCLMRKPEKAKLRKDFECALLYYVESGLPPELALSRLDVKHLGGFYARPPILWFPLDDAAKIYPLSMEHGKMSVFRLSVYLKKDVVPELLQMALNFVITGRRPLAGASAKISHQIVCLQRLFAHGKQNVIFKI